MTPTHDPLIRVLRLAARAWWRDFAEFRLPGNGMNTTEVSGMLMATCGVINSGIDDADKPVARIFEDFERPQKLALIGEALARYQTA